jgi:hypothetical protein
VIEVSERMSFQNLVGEGKTRDFPVEKNRFSPSSVRNAAWSTDWNEEGRGRSKRFVQVLRVNRPTLRGFRSDGSGGNKGAEPCCFHHIMTLNQAEDESSPESRLHSA